MKLVCSMNTYAPDTRLDSHSNLTVHNLGPTPPSMTPPLVHQELSAAVVECHHQHHPVSDESFYCLSVDIQSGHSHQQDIEQQQ